MVTISSWRDSPRSTAKFRNRPLTSGETKDILLTINQLSLSGMAKRNRKVHQIHEAGR
jgi:hypothetical protein